MGSVEGYGGELRVYDGEGSSEVRERVDGVMAAYIKTLQCTAQLFQIKDCAGGWSDETRLLFLDKILRGFEACCATGATDGSFVGLSCSEATVRGVLRDVEAINSTGAVESVVDQAFGKISSCDKIESVAGLLQKSSGELRNDLSSSGFVGSNDFAGHVRGIHDGDVGECMDVQREQCREVGSGRILRLDEIAVKSRQLNCDNVRGKWHKHNRAKKLRKKCLREQEKKMMEEKEKKPIDSDVVVVKKKSNYDAIRKKENWRKNMNSGEDNIDFSKDNAASESTQSFKNELRLSLEAKWSSENKLAALKAERAYNALLSIPVDEYNRREQLRIRADNERKMVSIEKTHATLRATGNVPGAVGSVETVLDSTISPDSSASMQEFRRVQKENLDLLDKVKRMEKKFGIDSNDLDFLEKQTYTDTSENHEKLLKYVPGDFGIIPVGEGDDGKNYFKVELLGGDVY